MSSLHSVIEEENVKAIMACLDVNMALIAKIHEVVERFSEKRVTLEEKMIRSYFHQLAGEILQVNARVHTAMAENYTKPSQSSLNTSELDLRHKVIEQGLKDLREALKPLENIQAELTIQIDELLKVLAYDLNFMEQYFEHGFYSRLTNDENFLEALRAYKESLK